MSDKPRKPVFDADADPLNADWIRRLARQRAAHEPTPAPPPKRNNVQRARQAKTKPEE